MGAAVEHIGLGADALCRCMVGLCAAGLAACTLRGGGGGGGMSMGLDPCTPTHTRLGIALGSDVSMVPFIGCCNPGRVSTDVKVISHNFRQVRMP